MIFDICKKRFTGVGSYYKKPIYFYITGGIHIMQPRFTGKMQPHMSREVLVDDISQRGGYCLINPHLSSLGKQIDSKRENLPENSFPKDKRIDYTLNARFLSKVGGVNSTSRSVWGDHNRFLFLDCPFSPHTASRIFNLHMFYTDEHSYKTK